MLEPAERLPSGLVAQLPERVDAAFLRRLVSARSGVERAIFKAGLDTIGATGLKALRRLLMENAGEQAALSHNEGALDLSFEAKVAELTGNELLFDLQSQIHQVWTLAWSRYGSYPESRSLLHREHLAILATMEKGDAARVLRLVERHVDKALD